jgi:hypothetical protein
MKGLIIRALSRAVIVVAVIIGAPTVAHAAAGRGITYADNTVVIPASVVKSQLVSIDEGVYTFRSASGPLAQLKTGKVMVLQGSASGVITSATTQGGKLVVHATDPTIGQVLKSGTLTYDFTPDWHTAVSAPFDVPGDNSDAQPAVLMDDGAPTLPFARVAAAATHALSLQGSVKGWGYSITGTPAGPGKVAISGQLCLGYDGSECGNGPSQATAVEFSFTGMLDLDKIRGDLTVNNGVVQAAKTVFQDVKSSVKMDYTFSNGHADPTAKLPALHIPIGWDIPIPGQPVPLFVRVQFAALLQVLTKPAKNTVTHGELETTYSGTATAAGGKGNGAAGGTGDKASGSVNGGKKGLGISLNNLGIDLTLQERAGLAFGLPIANLMGFTDFTSTIGQEQKAAIAGGFCSSYIGVSDWGVGVAGEVGGGILGAHAEIRKSLVQKQYYFTEPGCTKIQG